MLLRRAEAKDFSNEPKADLNFVEDGIYPASFVKCTEEQGKFGPQIKWLFTIDETHNLKIFVNIYTPMDWAPGNKLDSFLVAMGVDTTNNFDITTFNTDSIAKGSKLLIMVQKKQAKSTGNIYLAATKFLPYSANSRSAQPLDFPQEHIIMPQVQQQPQAQGLNVQYGQPAPNYQQPVQQPFQQHVFTPTGAPQAPRVTNVNMGGAAQVKKVDFTSNL